MMKNNLIFAPRPASRQGGKRKKTNLFIKILLIIALVILQMSLFSKFSFFSSIPNIIFLLSLTFLLRGFVRDSFLVGILGGLFLDLSSPLRFGIYTLFLAVNLLFIYFVVLKNIPEQPAIIIIFGIFLACFLFLNLMVALLGRFTPNWQLLVDAGLNALWGVIIYSILRKTLTGREETKLI